MGDSGKPFACTEIGCNQRFVNEDHLEVHRRKHEMSLGLRDLKSLDTPVIADQTPTPTRFLKNCEEVGLFNEHPNPFDALFRKASFRGSDATESSSPKIDSDPPLDASHPAVEIDVDTEHVLDESPQQAVSSTTGDETQRLEEAVFIENNLAAQVVEVSTISPTQTLLPILQQAPMSEVQTMPTTSQISVMARQYVHANCNTIPISGPILLRLPGGQTIPIVPPSVANPHAPIPVAISAMPQISVVIDDGTEKVALDSTSVKQKLKNSLLTNQSQGNMGVMTQAVDVVTRQQGMVQQSVNYMSQASSPGSPEGQMKRRRRNSDMSPDEKREKFLERNRAAATRCRTKRKVWVNSLEQKADELNNTNSLLMSEVTKLKEEVAQLKQLLLAHNDCPVTVMQRETHGNMFAASVDMQQKAPSVSGADAGSPTIDLMLVEEVNQLPR